MVCVFDEGMMKPFKKQLVDQKSKSEAALEANLCKY